MDAANGMANWDPILWWVMLGTGITAAILSLVATILDRTDSVWPGRQARYLLHMAGYIFMTISVLTFVIRGLIAV